MSLTLFINSLIEYSKSIDYDFYFEENNKINYIIDIFEVDNNIKISLSKVPDDKSFLLPRKFFFERSRNIKPIALYDNFTYIFGKKDITRQDKFFDLLLELTKGVYDENFIKRIKEEINKFSLKDYPEIKDSSNFLFRINKNFLHENDIIKENVKKYINLFLESKKDGVSFYTGEKGKIGLHPQCHLIVDSKSNAKFSSNNEDYSNNKVYCPILVKESLAYKVAYQKIIDNKNYFIIDNGIYLYYSKNPKLDKSINEIFSLEEISSKISDESNYKKLFSLKDRDIDTTNLCLAYIIPNSARNHLQLYSEISGENIKNNYNKWENDLNIDGNIPSIKDINKLREFLYKDVLYKKWNKLHILEYVLLCKNIEEDFINEIVNNFYSLSNRHQMTAVSLMKLFLIRKNKKEILMEFDKDNKSAPYLLGRIFAFAHYYYNIYHHKFDNSFTTDWYRRFLDNPADNYMLLIEKIFYWQKFLSKEFNELNANLSKANNIPNKLSNSDKNEFAIAYYQQTTELFNKNNSQKDIESDKGEDNGSL